MQKTNGDRNEILCAHKLAGQRQKFKGFFFFTGNAHILLYACFSFILSPRLIIDRRITKIGTNDCYHG